MESPEQPQPLLSEISSTNPTLPTLTAPRICFALSSPPPTAVAGAGAEQRNQSIITMEAKFRELILKIVNSNAKPVQLTDRHKTLIEQTLTDFFADFHTPDHPPYAAMIQRAIEELKENGGSSEDSISKYIKNEYNDLPWAHNTLLKHHLGKLCDVGEVIVTRKGFYLLAGANPKQRNSSGRNEKLKRRRSSASGRMRSKRLKKDETEDDDREREEDMEVIKRKHQITGKCHEEIAKLNETVEREAEMIEDSQLLGVPIELIDEHVEGDQQYRKMLDYEVNDQRSAVIEGRRVQLTHDAGFSEEHRSYSNIATKKQREFQVFKKPSLLRGQENSSGLYAKDIQLEDQKVEKIKEKKQQLKQQNKVIEEHSLAGQFQCWREVACDDNDEENDFGNYSKFLPSESCGTLFVGENEYLMEGEKQKMSSCGIGKVLPKQTYQASISLSDLNMDLGQPDEEIQPNASTPERPPGFSLALADGFSQTKQQQSKDFGLLKACNLLSVTDSLDLPLKSTTLDKEGHIDSKKLPDVEQPILEDSLQKCRDPSKLEQLKHESQSEPSESTIDLPKNLLLLELSHQSGNLSSGRHQELSDPKNPLEFELTTVSPSRLVNLGMLNLEQQKVPPDFEKSSKHHSSGNCTKSFASEIHCKPSNSEKIEHEKLLEFPHPGKSLETIIPPRTSSLSISLNPEAFEQERHDVLPNEKCLEPQLAAIEELSFTIQEIKEQGQKLQLQQRRRNSEFKKKMSNPEGSEKKHDRAKRIQPPAKGMMAPDLTLNSSKIEKQSLSELPNPEKSISQEQKQPEEPIPQPGIMIASCSLPMDRKHLDRERQPYISDPIRPIEFGQVVVEESSQNNRMRRQLKRWNQTTLELHDRPKRSRFRAKEVENHNEPIDSEKIGQEKQVECVSAEKSTNSKLRAFYPKLEGKEKQVEVSERQEEPISQPEITTDTSEFSVYLKHLDPEVKPNVSDPESPVGLELVLVEQDEILHQLELLTPARPQKSKQAPERSNQIAGQRSKLRSWKTENTLEPNANIIALHSPLALQLPQESEETQEELSKILVQRSKLRSGKRENQFEQNTNAVAGSLYLPLASLPPALPTPQKSVELQQVEKVSVAAKEKSQHKKSRLSEPESATSGNMRESFPSQNRHEEQKQPEHHGRGRSSKMKGTTTLVPRNLSKFTAVNLEGKSQKNVLSKAKMDQNQHGQGKPEVSTRGRLLKVRREIDNSEEVLLAPSPPNTFQEEEEEEEEEEKPKYRGRGRPPKHGPAKASMTKKTKTTGKSSSPSLKSESPQKADLED